MSDIMDWLNADLVDDLKRQRDTLAARLADTTDWYAEAIGQIDDVMRRLAEAEALLREARRKLQDMDNMNSDQFVDDGIGIDGHELIEGINAALADSASDECECPVEGHAPGCPNDLFTKLRATDQPSVCSTCDGSGSIYRNDLIWNCPECNTGTSDKSSAIASSSAPKTR